MDDADGLISEIEAFLHGEGSPPEAEPSLFQLSLPAMNADVAASVMTQVEHGLGALVRDRDDAWRAIVRSMLTYYGTRAEPADVLFSSTHVDDVMRILDGVLPDRGFSIGQGPAAGDHE